MDVTLQKIFQTHFSDYAKGHSLPLKHHKAAKAIMRCRTPEQGGHVQCCPEGHESHIQYHSCRHRSCPLCNALPKAQWAQAQYQRLLSVDHYHVIFTLPHELLPLWRYNTRWFTQQFFSVVSDTLMRLCRDERHLGAAPGMVLSLHTWGRTLILHPHIHCLVTGGGLTTAGQWRDVKNSFFLPARLVRSLYRKLWLSLLWPALSAGELTLPGDSTLEAQRALLKQAGKKKWNVRIQPPYAHGRGVMNYLARYVKGGAISNTRLKGMGRETVSLVYKDHHDGKQKPLSLKVAQFMTRVLAHVNEPRQHVIRHYGLYSHHAKVKRNRCRAQLGQSPEADSTPLTWQSFIEEQDGCKKGQCSQCGKALIRTGVLGKNSIYKHGGSGSVQQFVQADLSTWFYPTLAPP